MHTLEFQVDLMGDDSNQSTLGTSQVEIKKAVEEALKGFPGFSTLLEAAGKLTQPVEDDEPSEREDNSTKLGGKSRMLCRLRAPYHQTRGEKWWRPRVSEVVPCGLSHEVNGPVGSGVCFICGLASTNATESTVWRAIWSCWWLGMESEHQRMQ